MSRVTTGAPEPLGVTLDETGGNVAVFSAHAKELFLCLFGDDNQEIERIRLTRKGDVFCAHVTGLTEGQRYGFRAYGPDAPGHRFNGAKLLVDPYALALDRALKLHPSQFAFGDSADADSAPFTAKSVMTCVAAAPPGRPRTAWRDTVLYELHVKGFTATHPGIPRDLRGTFGGLAHEAAILHLKKMGVTTIELLPCAAWIDERHLPPLGLSNYWGYNPIAMMAPDPRLAPGGWHDVRDAVAALHAAGLEVILDVVFNHSGESDEFGPTLSFRGLDNATYYRLAEDPARYVNDAGCGNTLALDRAPVVRLAMDALRTWAVYGGVDGFRFDLATTLARGANGFNPDAPFLTALMQDPLLRELKLIAEPWDLGPGGYHLGQFPTPVAEWNDRYRDAARRFWRGDPVGVSELATRLAGSQDVFARRSPSKSVNFIVAHDGFTLQDLVSYSHKRNDANGEDNRDGVNENLSWNNGVEGATDDPAILAARARDQRNLLATLLFSRATPMLAMGAELGHTQKGNNNAYAQDNDSSWLNWAAADHALIAATAQLISLRKAHVALRDDRFLDGETSDETLLPDVQWLRPDGAPMQEEDWRCGDAATLIAALHAKEDRVLLILHRGETAQQAAIPEPREGWEWRLAFDSSQGEAGSDAIRILAPPRAVLLLVEEKGAKPASAPAVDDALLAQLAQGAGVATQWRDVDGADHDVPRDTLLALLASLGLPARTRADARDSLASLAKTRDRRTLPQSVVARENEGATFRLHAQDAAPARLFLVDEDGREEMISPVLQPYKWRSLDGRVCQGFRAGLPPLPAGRYRLRVENGEESALVVAPPQCWSAGDNRTFGFSAQLYSLRRDGDQGIGDFTTLARLSEKSREAGAAFVAINPLHALFPQDRMRASPYYPSDRRFLDPLYIDLAGLPEACFDEAAARGLRDRTAVDYPAVQALKGEAFEAAFAAFDDLARRQPDAAAVVDFEIFRSQGGEALSRFALFETISERRRGESWRDWPQALRDADPGALACFSRANETRLRFHEFLQWRADRQFGAAAKAAPICRDLAVGAAPDGAESWRRAASLTDGFSIGAPPDPFSRDGQNWGLPAPDPLAIEADGGAEFAGLLRANMRHAGALRIDHVMGLARLFLVPHGEKASAGAYVSYPLDLMLANLALESRRARCAVIGEDLGTVPWGFRERLDAANVLSYRVLWFERRGESFVPPRDYPQRAMACVSTHDLPTLAGWWEGVDIAEKQSLGLISPEAARDAHALRERDKSALLGALQDEGLLASPTTTFDDALARALHAFIARTPAALAVAQLDDLAGETVAVNLPGTDRERDNWRRKLTASIETLFATSRARAILEGLRRRNLDDISAAYFADHDRGQGRA